MQAFCPAPCPGDGHSFPCSVLSVSLLLVPSKDRWPLATEWPWEKSGVVPLFPGEYARQLMVQALFLLLGSLVPHSVHPGKERTVPQLPVPSRLGHIHICPPLPVCAPPHG